MPFPLLLLIPVASKIINVVKNTEIGAAVVESVKDTAIGNIMDTVLTKTGLQYDVEKGIGGLESGISGLQSGVNELQSSVNVLSADVAEIGQNVSEIGQNVSQIGEGIAQHSMMLSSIQSSISALGMMSAVGCTLSAVSVFQLIKVQRSLNRVEKKIDDGFIDLKVFFSEQLQNLLNEQQKQRLAQAYNHYRKALEQLQISLLIQDPINKKLSINSCIDVFIQSLAIYDDKQEFQYINAPAKLRRLECCWSLESAIAESRYLQEEYAASLHSYERLRQRIMAETEMLKLEMNDNNYNFIIADLHWIFENDIKIINAKIDLLNHYLACNTFEPVKIQANNTEQSENLFKNTCLSSAQLYLECLLSTEKMNDVKTAVIENKSFFKDVKYDYIDFNKLPVIHFCDIHVELFGKSQALAALGQAVDTKIIRLLENYFLDQKNVNHKLSVSDPQLRIYLSTLNSTYSFEKEIIFFNTAVKEYAEKVTHFILDNRQIDRGKRESLRKTALGLGLSENFSQKFNEMLSLFHERNVNKYLSEHSKLAISLAISDNSTSLSQESKSVLVQFEQNIPLNKTEIEENRREIALLFFDAKNAVILNNDLKEINSNNEVLVWKVQDVLQTSEALSRTFLEGCQKSIQQYRESFKTLSVHKGGLSEIDKSILAEIQRKNNLNQESVDKITGRDSFFKMFWL